MTNFNCVVPGCKADARKAKNLTKYPWMKNIHFYSFPHKKKFMGKLLREKWITAVRRERGWEPKYGSKICSMHFSQNMPTPQRPVPDIFPWGQVIPYLADMRKEALKALSRDTENNRRKEQITISRKEGRRLERLNAKREQRFQQLSSAKGMEAQPQKNEEKKVKHIPVQGFVQLKSPHPLSLANQNTIAAQANPTVFVSGMSTVKSYTDTSGGSSNVMMSVNVGNTTSITASGVVDFSPDNQMQPCTNDADYPQCGNSAGTKRPVLGSTAGGCKIYPPDSPCTMVLKMNDGTLKPVMINAPQNSFIQETKLGRKILVVPQGSLVPGLHNPPDSGISPTNQDEGADMPSPVLEFDTTKRENECNIGIRKRKLATKKAVKPGRRSTHSSLQNAIRKTALYKSFACSLCKMAFSDIKDLDAHVSEKHTVNSNLLCGICGAKLSNITAMATHMQIHMVQKEQRGANRFPCTLCHKVFIQADHLELHLKHHANSELPIGDLVVNRKFPCRYCERVFAKFDQRRRHMVMHRERFQCSYCGKCLRNKSLYIAHTRCHTGEKPFSCSLCDRKFGSKSQVRLHQFMHTGEKKYACEMCGKKFISGYSLKIHMTLHTGQKDHVCSICGRAFRIKRNLLFHEGLHTDREKTELCNLCGKAFSRKQYLRYHEKRCAAKAVRIGDQ